MTRRGISALLHSDGEAALGLVALGVGGLVEHVVSPGGKVVAGQVRRHHVLDLRTGEYGGRLTLDFVD